MLWPFSPPLILSQQLLQNHSESTSSSRLSVIPPPGVPEATLAETETTLRGESAGLGQLVESWSTRSQGEHTEPGLRELVYSTTEDSVLEMHNEDDDAVDAELGDKIVEPVERTA